jgi:hypothetical protein
MALHCSCFSARRAAIKYCPFAPKAKWGVVFVDPLPSILHTEGNFQARFSRRKSIQCSTLYRPTSSFFALLKYFDVQIWWQCVMPGVISSGGMGRNNSRLSPRRLPPSIPVQPVPRCTLEYTLFDIISRGSGSPKPWTVTVHLLDNKASVNGADWL